MLKPAGERVVWSGVSICLALTGMINGAPEGIGAGEGGKLEERVLRSSIVSQRQVVRRFPQVVLEGSEMNLRYLRAVEEAHRERPQLFAQADWPMQIAIELFGTRMEAEVFSPKREATCHEALIAILNALNSLEFEKASRDASVFDCSEGEGSHRVRELGKELLKRSISERVLKRGAAEVAREIERLRNNASTARLPNKLRPEDRSGSMRAAVMIRDADELEGRYREEVVRLERASREVADSLKALVTDLLRKLGG